MLQPRKRPAGPCPGVRRLRSAGRCRAGRLWDANPPDGTLPHYVQEPHGLYYTLRHAGYVVDFVDGTDILERNALGRYRALYVTEPNLPWAVQQRIAPLGPPPRGI